MLTLSPLPNFGVTKTNSLFPAVLRHLGTTSKETVFVGDNEERDVKPALAEGIFAIHFAESKNASLNTIPPQINTLRKLQFLL